MSAVAVSPRASNGFDAVLRRNGLEPVRRAALTTLQVNVGKLCNQACHHCHVDAGPKRTETMTEATARRVVELLGNSNVEFLDLTGGAPELNPNFRWLVERGRALGVRVMDRCNLTVLFEPGQEDTPEFLRDNRVELVCSLPCYTAENVDRQRGSGVFDRSIEGLLRLNRLGFGKPSSGLILDLVYNPLGASLPPRQSELEAEFREELRSLFGIEFNRLLTITNMPIKRFADQLRRCGQLDEYESLLIDSFNLEAAAQIMCRTLVSVGWDGALYDCDFNQMLEIPLVDDTRPQTIWDIDKLDTLTNRRVATEKHCFGCTAGAGSSCTGALRS
jgi:radical SAM/Cys-rich protein